MPERERYMRLRGDGTNVNRYRVNREDTHVHLYLDVRGEYTLAELLDTIGWLASPEDVRFRGGCFVITQPATQEDREGWRAADERREERAKESRREWYERLKVEFEGDADA